MSAESEFSLSFVLLISVVGITNILHNTYFIALGFA